MDQSIERFCVYEERELLSADDLRRDGERPARIERERKLHLHWLTSFHDGAPNDARTRATCQGHFAARTPLL